MSTPSLTNVTLKSLQNTSADTLADLLLLPHALMPMMAKMLLFITTGMKMINSSSRPFRLWNSLLAWSNTSRKNISNKSDTMDFMQGIANLTKDTSGNRKGKRRVFLSFNRWRDLTLASFGYDPLACPCCGQTMLFLDLYHNHQHLSLNEMYERAMGKLSLHSSAWFLYKAPPTMIEWFKRRKTLC